MDNDGTPDKESFLAKEIKRIVLGYSDYSEYFICHSGSTYWRKKDSKKAVIFLRIEPYLTFQNVHQLERQGADTQNKVEELEQLNQSMKDRDKMK